MEGQDEIRAIVKDDDYLTLERRLRGELGRLSHSEPSQTDLDGLLSVWDAIIVRWLRPFIIPLGWEADFEPEGPTSITFRKIQPVAERVSANFTPLPRIRWVEAMPRDLHVRLGDRSIQQFMTLRLNRLHESSTAWPRYHPRR